MPEASLMVSSPITKKQGPSGEKGPPLLSTNATEHTLLITIKKLRACFLLCFSTYRLIGEPNLAPPLELPIPTVPDDSL